ncbi:3-keto-disaccharide hydrolase, partial [Klebsiella aerogenes]|uniref:3-keto-disaccharide hydrolase n=1 Tax=Klebsiella aerogenes TaxID=548 RepID=UPI0013D6BE19
PVWGKSINLIQGNTLTGWKASSTATNQWQVIDGVLTSPKSGVNLITEEQFEDFKLHVEFRYPAGSNSGV